MPELFPYQIEGARHLAGGRFRLLADDMGLGKSAQAVRAADLVGAERVTVICPAIVASDWRETFYAFGDMPRGVAVAGGREPYSPDAAAACVVSYDRAAQPAVAKMLRARGGRLILDEAHYLKNLQAKRTKAVLSKTGIAGGFDTVDFLTGTPIPNHVGELFPMLRAAGRYVAKYHDYMRQFAVIRETPFGEKIVGHRNTAQLKQLLDGWMLRRLNQVVLPESRRGELQVEPSECDPAHPVLAKLRRLEPEAAAAIEAAIAIGDLTDLETPHVSTLRRLTGMAKVGAVARRAAELLQSEPDAKLVLFCQHRAVLEHLVSALRDFGPVLIAGGEGETKRTAAKFSFQNAAHTRVAVCQMQAAGTGITLTAANHLWIVEPSWVPSDNDQAVKRILRIGQLRKTSVQFVSLINSIDETVNRVLLRKRQLIDEILN